MFGILKDLPIVGDLTRDLLGAGLAEDRQQALFGFTESQNAASRQFNAAESQKARDFEERMANTRYQRGRADLEAAGYNPMLAYMNSAAPNPTGHAASSNAGSAGVASPTPGNTGTAASMQSASQIDVNRAIEERTKAEAEKTRAEKAEIEARTPRHAVDIEHLKQQIGESAARTEKWLQDASTSAYSAQHIQQQTANLKALLPQIEATINNLIAQTKLSGAQHQEITQRVKQNLPEIERALRDIEHLKREMEMPKRAQDFDVHRSAIGTISAYLRALNPLQGLIGVGK